MLFSASIALAAAATLLNTASAQADVYVGRGCFRDSIMTRAFTLSSTTGRQVNIETCATFCQSAGSDAFGLENGNECYCSAPGQVAALQRSTECNLPCQGNPTQICGGQNALSVYNFGVRSAVQCAQDFYPTRRALSGPSQLGRNDMTGQQCASFCLTRGFTIYGTENARECFCGTEADVNTLQSPTSSCNEPCSGNPNEFCGGDNAISVGRVILISGSVPSSTAASSSAPTRTALPFLPGCFEDFNTPGGRALKGPSIINQPNMTPDVCREFCRTQGFPYYGVEFSRECYCGTAEDVALLNPETGCSSPCSGNPTITCGGSWRIYVYPPIPVSSSSSVPSMFSTTSSSSSASSSTSTTTISSQTSSTSSLVLSTSSPLTTVTTSTAVLSTTTSALLSTSLPVSSSTDVPTTSVPTSLTSASTTAPTISTLLTSASPSVSTTSVEVSTTTTVLSTSSFTRFINSTTSASSSSTTAIVISVPSSSTTLIISSTLSTPATSGATTTSVTLVVPSSTPSGASTNTVTTTVSKLQSTVTTPPLTTSSAPAPSPTTTATRSTTSISIPPLTPIIPVVLRSTTTAPAVTVTVPLVPAPTVIPPQPVTMAVPPTLQAPPEQSPPASRFITVATPNMQNPPAPQTQPAVVTNVVTSSSPVAPGPSSGAQGSTLPASRNGAGRLAMSFGSALSAALFFLVLA